MSCTCNCHEPKPITEAETERFWSKVEKSEGCWEWTGSRNQRGYGVFGFRGSQVRAHRFIYELEVREIEPGKLIDHICRNRGCVRPSHLRPVTHAENVQNQDGHRDGRSGRRGVAWHPSSGKWRAGAQVRGKYYHGGYFSNIEEAAEAARQLRLKVHTHNDLDRRTA